MFAAACWEDPGGAQMGHVAQSGLQVGCLNALLILNIQNLITSTLARFSYYICVLYLTVRRSSGSSNCSGCTLVLDVFAKLASLQCKTGSQPAGSTAGALYSGAASILWQSSLRCRLVLTMCRQICIITMAYKLVTSHGLESSTASSSTVFTGRLGQKMCKISAMSVCSTCSVVTKHAQTKH